MISQTPSPALSGMLSGVWRVKWAKYRWVLIGGLVNIILINHFFFNRTIIDLGPFHATTDVDHAPSKLTVQIPKKPLVATIPPPSKIFNNHDYDFDGEYVGWPLQRVCEESTWTPGLTFVCDNNSGGIGNIRNFILTCVRYAIEAGATQLVLPRIQRRSEEDLANIFEGVFQEFSYFFDEEHFRNSLGTFCPQMTIYNNVTDIPYAEVRTKVLEFYPKDLGDKDGCDERGINRHLDMFRSKFDNWLETTQRMPNVTTPVSIRFRWAVFFEWPIYRDGPEFAATFGGILRLRKDVQYLAAQAIKELHQVVGLKPTSKTLRAPYLGVHLRTESDALGFWPNFEEQSQGYLAQAERHSLKHAYLACGSPTEGKRFSDLAWQKLNLTVTTKLDLLKGNDLANLTALSWDQQALVDFLILTKSTHFTGCSFSSFTMNIAFKRHLMTGGIQTRPWKSPGDAFTTLIGRFNSWFGDWMFMYECMWP
ncbi:hypothetical protein D0Z07_7242 [Hyphodiscus hymeniophilus]|uniref:Uncharacterized protein n=1 Tax=Hyphodiscus hymeniophilus TaxID=353542 RepID=A0A9P6VGB0_9HELO|nr:hypothetical protein D0Z07_7242 [Hyphodiscus hymeniophilus]